MSRMCLLAKYRGQRSSEWRDIIQDETFEGAIQRKVTEISNLGNALRSVLLEKCPIWIDAANEYLSYEHVNIHGIASVYAGKQDMEELLAIAIQTVNHKN